MITPNLFGEIKRAVFDESEEMVAFGEVTSVTPLQVRFAGDISADSDVLRLSSYTAVTNEKVALMRIGDAWMIIGKIST